VGVVSVRRLPAAAGVRPPRRPVIVRRRCVVCGRRFSLNRRRQPWARAVTCGPACRVAWAHRRRFAGCRHCDVVASWRELVDAFGEPAGGDEFARPPTFGEFLSGFRFERWDEEEAA
jgi:hypothetical protein